MRKTLTALVAATTLGVIALPSSAEARWGWGWGGLAAGAIVGGALAAGAYNPYYGYPADTTVTTRTGANGSGAIGKRATGDEMFE
jgi:hypothetical protein